jgi:hypothetical protein
MGDGSKYRQGGKGGGCGRQIARPRKAGIVDDAPPVADGLALDVKGDHA